MNTSASAPRSLTALGALVGLTAAGVALGVAELVAGLNRTWKSPVLDVGDRVIDRVPVFVKDFAIETFGTKDKPALLLGIGAVLALYAMVLGALAVRRRLAIGVIGFSTFGLIGAWAALARRGGGSVGDAIPALVGTAAGASALWLAHRVLRPRAMPRSSAASEVDRRAVLVRGGSVIAALAIVGGGAGAVGRAIKGRFSAAESRARVVLPTPANEAGTVPAGTSLDVDGMAPFVTPNSEFYRIDTALTIPQLPTDIYELRVKGMVDRELRFSYDDLLARNLVEHDITLTCVSNTIGGELIGNARWLGVRLDEILMEAGVRAGADQVVGRSVDGYTCGFPLAAATDGRNALLAIGMNGEPLPLEHGFPVRLIVPGLYGYVSATKWLTEIEVTTFEDFQAYWVPRGYAEQAPIKLMSRIDSVDGLGTLPRNGDGQAAIGGYAWAQTRGISKVEVQIDEGPWQEAELGEALNDDTWRQWAFHFTPAALGRTSIRCRATDRSGEIQTAERSEPLPNGASGHHQIVVFVE